MEFPKLVFRSPGPNQCQGGTYAHLSVVDHGDLDAALAAGWHATLPEALAPVPVPVPAPAPAATPVPLAQDAPAPLLSRDEMKRKADDLGLTYPHNISNIKLAELLDAALAAG